MILLTYIFSTVLLSLVGLAVYGLLCLFRPSFAARRVLLWLILAVSLLLPISPPFARYKVQRTNSAEAPAKTLISSPVAVGAKNVRDFCHCSKPHAGDVILYQTSRVFDFLFAHQRMLGLVLLGIGLLLATRIFWKLGRLLYVVGKYRAEQIAIKGKQLTIIRDVPGLPAASLRLGGKFVFLNKDVDALSDEEQGFVLLHEYAHIKHRNSYEKVFLALLQVIWWPNPAFYIISSELELISEYMADGFVVGQNCNKKRYANLLLSMKTGQAFAPLHFFRGSRLARRIRQILLPGSKPKMRLIPALSLWLILMWPGEILTKTLLDDQFQEIEVYELLSERNHETGQLEFCKKCTIELVQGCYFETME